MTTISGINWKGVDLNLLLSFKALMDKRSVTYAAEQLHLGQSAMSYNLNRLRTLFNDPLFERQGNTMVPTRRALELLSPIEQVLNVIGTEILTPATFEPRQYQGAFHIGLSDYAELVFGPLLFDAITGAAPDAQLVFHAIDDSNCQSAFDAGTLDIAIGSFSTLPDQLSHQPLYRERHMCLFDNTTMNYGLPLSLKNYLNTPQAIITSSGGLSTPVDATLATKGMQRQVQLGSSRFLTLKHLLHGRNLLCVMAELVCRSPFFGESLSISEPPIAIGDFDIELVQKRSDESHPRMGWLSDTLTQLIVEHRQQLLNGEFEHKN
ncbi:LysR family transcriptional regulator [Ferrimonas aestuarii]|uniref:LysR family transcriptional regulator n=1 Tax=Ferrimonas aestuarii TaxID=2569539 RepID=A0A4U1BLF2_9GAMM|nr:LysR family transcriptional regulator [Ferrimonas aestuarii]TKB53919.1 LysR family transcriptional regulator [Ferrimonas aestuarii]